MGEAGLSYEFWGYCGKVKLALELRRLLSEHTLLRRVGTFVWHFFGIVVTYALAFVLRSDFDAYPADAAFLSTWYLAVFVYLSMVVVFRLYAGLWTYFSYDDCLRYLCALGLGSIILAGVIFLQRGFSFDGYPRSVPIIHCMLLLIWEIGGRMAMRFERESWSGGRRNGAARNGKKALVIGAPDEADAILRALGRRSDDLGEIAGLVTGARMEGTIRGVKILGDMDVLPTLLRRVEPETIVILPPYEKPRQIKEIIDTSVEAGLLCQYRIVPSVREIAGGQLCVSSLREVLIEDLLDRPETRFDLDLLTNFVSGRQVMVTGAGGSIGSELCRQMLKLKPRKLVLFEQCEFALFEIDRELRNRFPEMEIVAVTGNICDQADVQQAISSVGGIDVIYHAAAYKHVHLMELNTAAAMRNNVFGTVRLAEVAERMNVKHFIMISTDKAVNPTSMMGCSKRLAERVLLERPLAGTRYLAVRFGNVLGSSGSVIPIFQQQIRDGGPVTVTTKEARRYFMTIPEAVQLVMMSGVVGEDRHIMVLEMGEPVRIWDLAKRMIELSGLMPDKDIPIVFTGLRPGEKEYEELLTNDEDVVPTDYEQIAVFAKTQDQDEGALETLDLEELDLLIRAYDREALRDFCRRSIPEHLLDGNGDETEAGRASEAKKASESREKDRDDRDETRRDETRRDETRRDEVSGTGFSEAREKPMPIGE